MKRNYSTKEWTATGLSRLIPSAFLAWFTGPSVPVLPCGFINSVYFAALFRVREMREDYFLNQRNSGNRDQAAKEIKAGQVVQSGAEMTWSEYQDLICPLFVMWGGNSVPSLDGLIMQPLCVALRQEELGIQTLFFHTSVWFPSHCNFAPVFPSARYKVNCFGSKREATVFPVHSTHLSVETSSDIFFSSESFFV